MKLKLSSLRFRMLLPVLVTTLFVVALFTVLFSRTYTNMILQEEQEENDAGFDQVSRTIQPLISDAINEVQSVMNDERVVSYAGLRYSTDAELVHARLNCRDYLRSVISRQAGIFGLLFMRQDGSLFGALPEGNFFLDEPQQNPLPEALRSRILDAPLGQTVWVGPVSGASIYGFENAITPERIMIAAWKSRHVSYGECYALMLMDESIFAQLFVPLRDGESTWRLFTAEQTEIYYSGTDACPDPERLLSESNSGTVFEDENGRSVCTFSMQLDAPDWILVRELSMESHEQVLRRVRLSVVGLGVVVFLIALVIYHLWLRKFMQQFGALLKGIQRMGRGELEPAAAGRFSIGEFETMHQEIDRTSLALNRQMDTIRRMERAQAEQENKIKEQERIVKELSLAREIQHSSMPHIFPPFPERKEIELFASMDPARDVGGDFYDFYLIDNDHLCLVIADVSGKGIPAALFMMISKRILEDFAKTERDPGRILAKANDALCDNNQAEMFVTVWLGILELSTGRLVAANAGHEYPAIRRRDGGFSLHRDRHGLVLGWLEETVYETYELQLAPGEKLFVYTDGVPEATAGSGEMFGLDRMLESLNSCTEDGPEAVLRGVRDAVDAFVGDAEQFDDLTMMCLEYRGPMQTAE